MLRLGGDGECELARAHVEGRPTLIDRLRDGSTLAGVPTPIPSHALAEWKPAGGGALRLNLTNNSIEANAGLAAFAEFDRLAHYGHEDVQVAAHEAHALARSLNGRATATAGAETKCRKWLCEKMSANPDRPESRELC